MREPQLRQAFAEYLRDARQAAGLQQKDLAQRLMVNASVVNRWERGVHLPEPKRVQQIAAALDLNPADLGQRLFAASAEEAGALRKEVTKLAEENKVLFEKLRELMAATNELVEELRSSRPRV